MGLDEDSYTNYSQGMAQRLACDLLVSNQMMAEEQAMPIASFHQFKPLE